MGKEIKNLEDCFEFLDEITEINDRNVWVNSNEHDAVVGSYHGLGMYIRNKLRLWDDDTELSKYFRSIGIIHGDDKSCIILTSYHRKCNNLLIDIEEQLPQYWKHWKQYNEFNLLPPNIKDIDEKYLNLYNSLNL